MSLTGGVTHCQTASFPAYKPRIVASCLDAVIKQFVQREHNVVVGYAAHRTNRAFLHPPSRRLCACLIDEETGYQRTLASARNVAE